MKIPVNKNIDEYKDDFFKGLTLRQTVVAASTLAVGIGGFFLVHLIFGIPQSISLYIVMPLAFAVGASGSLKIHGMSPYQYISKKMRITREPLYRSNPDAIWETYLQDRENQLKKKTAESKKPGKILLENEEEIQQRMKFYDEIFKEDGKGGNI